MESKNVLMCPICTSTSLSANKKGFNGAKASAGMLLAGPIGLTLGASGSKEIEITCLNCGETFKPGEGANSEDELSIKKQQLISRKESERSSKITGKVILFILLIIVCIVAYNMYTNIG